MLLFFGLHESLGFTYVIGCHLNGSLETFYINNFAQGQKALGTFALTALGRNAQLRRCAGGWGNGGDPQKRQAWDNVPRAAFACSTRQMYSSTFLKVWRRTEPIIIVAVRESIRKPNLHQNHKIFIKIFPFCAKFSNAQGIILKTRFFRWLLHKNVLSTMLRTKDCMIKIFSFLREKGRLTRKKCNRISHNIDEGYFQNRLEMCSSDNSALRGHI